MLRLDYKCQENTVNQPMAGVFEQKVEIPVQSLSLTLPFAT
jgi:hypothetical protein